MSGNGADVLLLEAHQSIWLTGAKLAIKMLGCCGWLLAVVGVEFVEQLSEFCVA